VNDHIHQGTVGSAKRDSPFVRRHRIGSAFRSRRARIRRHPRLSSGRICLRRGRIIRPAQENIDSQALRIVQPTLSRRFFTAVATVTSSKSIRGMMMLSSFFWSGLSSFSTCLTVRQAENGPVTPSESGVTGIANFHSTSETIFRNVAQNAACRSIRSYMLVARTF
jgi:hypothetical protein